MTATNNSSDGNSAYDHDQNTHVDSTRGNLLTDVQMSVEEVPMPSTTTQLALNDTTQHEIRTILERPVNLGTFDWKSESQTIPIQLKPSDYDADTATYIHKLNFPQDIFTNSPIVVQKLKNYQYFKADIEIEIKINAQPFLQGALMLVYSPYHEQTGDFRRKGTRFLASQTSCPYKIVSIEEGNSLKMTCPYANIYDMFDLSNSNNQFGTAFVYVLSPLLGATSNESAKYTIFARFVNPQFMVPTQKDVISEIHDSHSIKHLAAKGYTISKRYAQASKVPQAARDTGETTTTGPVSKVATGVSMISDVLSGIPIIGGFASSVSWVSRAVARTAASLGWSKPTSIVPQTKSVIKPNTTLIHTEGNDDATTLALLQDNGIDGSSFIPETKDEMNFKYIFGRPNFFHSKAVSATEFTGRKKITAWEVSPFSQYQYGNSEDPKTLYLGSFAYTSMLATLWRGTINYDIMLVKTPFHQGRFAVVFLPETNLEDVPDELGQLLNTNYNVVCNIKDRQDELGRTTFRVSVPFISNTPWRETYATITDNDNHATREPNAKTLDTKTGCLAIYSLVDLSHPPTVADSVTFFIAHSGGEDYQVARPVMNLSPGFQSRSTRSAKAVAMTAPEEEEVVPRRYAQSDKGAIFVPEDENLLVQSSNTSDVTAQTTGEYFQSLRAFMKRFGYLTHLAQSTYFVGLRTRHMSEDPTSGLRVMSMKNFTDYALPTPWYMSSFLFRFYNGSSQTKIVPYTAGLVAEAFVTFDEDTHDQTITPVRRSYGQPIFRQLQQMSNAFEVRTPFYRAIRCDVVNSTQRPVLGDVRTNLRCRNLVDTERAVFAGNSPLYEAAGDDFNFFFLVGPPPMCDTSNVATPTLIPSGAPVEVDSSYVTKTIVYSAYVSVNPFTFTPDLVPGTITHKITWSSRPTIPVYYSDGTHDDVPIPDCTIGVGSESKLGYMHVPRDTTKNVDMDATTKNIKLIGKFTVITDATPVVPTQ